MQKGRTKEKIIEKKKRQGTENKIGIIQIKIERKDREKKL